MAYQNRENLAYATIAVAPSPATSGTSLTVANGLGSLFPASNFSITLYPPGVDPLFSNAEICLVTSRTGDVFTIVRAQQGTIAKSVATGWQVANTITKLDFTLIQDSIIQSIVAGAGTVTAPTVVFSNSNGVSFGAAGSVITASVNTGTGGGMGSVNFSAGTTSNNLTDIVFSNSNGVSFGLNGSTITAQHNGLTSQSNQAFSAQGGSSAFQTLSFSNSNGITFSNSNGSVVASHNGITQQSTQPVAASASNGSFLFSTLGFSNANNVTFGTSAGSIITASVNAAAGGSINVSAGTTSNNLTNIVFSNSNGVSFGLDGSTITASVGAGVAAGSISAGTTSVALGQAIFSNSNGITFGLDGSTVTAAHNGLTSQSNQAASASNGSFTFQTLGFSNANNVTFGTSAGSIITASVNTAAGGGFTFTGHDPFVGGLLTATNQGNSTLHLQPLEFPNITFDRICVPILWTNANNSSGHQTVSMFFGLYTRNVSTLSLMSSTSFTTNFTNSGTAGSFSIYGGPRLLTIASTGLVTNGNYWAGFLSMTTASLSNATIQHWAVTQSNQAFSGILGAASTDSGQSQLGLGILSVQTAALPNSVAFTDMIGTNATPNRRPAFYFASASA